MNPKRIQSGGRDVDVYFLRPGAELAGYEFTPDEWSLIARLRQPTPLHELQRASGMRVDRIERLLKLLRIADALVIFPAVSGSPSQRVVVRPRPESADVEVADSEPAAPPDSDTRDLARSSWTRLRDPEPQVPPSVSPTRERSELRESARRPVAQQIWGGSAPETPSEARRPSPQPPRPSTPPTEARRPSPRPARPTSEPVPVARKSPLPERLSSRPAPSASEPVPVARKSPLPERPSPLPPPSAADVEAARAHFGRAQELAKGQRWRDALLEVERAISLDGFQAQYEALCGWLLHLTGLSSDRTDHRIDAHLIRALKLDPECAIAHYYRGMVRKRWADDHGAEAHLRRALDLDPKLIDAARELRFYDARRDRATPRETESGPLRRFVASLRSKGRPD